jgi:hypothetical protein
MSLLPNPVGFGTGLISKCGRGIRFARKPLAGPRDMSAFRFTRASDFITHIIEGANEGYHRNEGKQN